MNLSDEQKCLKILVMGEELDKMNHILSDFINSDAYKDYEKFYNKKKETVKNGPNTVHINYYEEILNAEDLKDYSKELEIQGLELSSFNKSGVIYNSIDEYTNAIAVIVSYELTKNIIFGVAGNLVYDAIKSIAKKYSLNQKI